MKEKRNRDKLRGRRGWVRGEKVREGRGHFNSHTTLYMFMHSILHTPDNLGPCLLFAHSSTSNYALPYMEHIPDFNLSIGVPGQHMLLVACNTVLLDTAATW